MNNSAAKKYKIKKVIGKIMMPNGNWKDNIKIFYGDTETEAEDNYLRWYEDCLGYDMSLPLSQLIEKYLYDVLIPKRDMHEATKQGYIGAYRSHFKSRDICKRPLKKITSLELQLVYDSMTCSIKMIRLINSLIYKLYSHLQKKNNIINIAEKVDLPMAKPVSGEIVVWTDEELEDIREGLIYAPALRFLIIMLIDTGCRISELLGLKYSDIKGNVLHITKQLVKVKDMKNPQKKPHFELLPPKSLESIRSIPLSDEVMEELEKHKKWQKEQMKKKAYETDLIFTTKNGTPIDKRTKSLTFKKFYKRIRVPYKPFHTYRHTFATNLCKKDVPIEITSKLLGHASVSVTAKYYINIDDKQLRDAVNKISPKKES